jgi:hypothetical protein
MHVLWLEQPGPMHDNARQRLSHLPASGNEQVYPAILESG